MVKIKKLKSSKFLEQIHALEVSNFERDALSIEQLKAIISNEQEAIFVYLHEHEIQGYIYLNIVKIERLVNIMKLIVKDDYQNRGIGQKLVLYVEKWCKYKGIRTILLEVRQSNTSAISFYMTLGYRELTTRKNFYQFPQEDALVFEKQLKRFNFKIK